MRGAGLLAVIALCACQSAQDPVPVARIELAPAHIPEGDDFSTPVLMDGRRSLPAPGEETLHMGWAFQIEDTQDGYRVAPEEEQPGDCAGHMLAPCVLVRFAGDHPVPVTLTVTSGGITATTRRTLGLTVE